MVEWNGRELAEAQRDEIGRHHSEAMKERRRLNEELVRQYEDKYGGMRGYMEYAKGITY